MSNTISKNSSSSMRRNLRLRGFVGRRSFIGKLHVFDQRGIRTCTLHDQARTRERIVRASDDEHLARHLLHESQVRAPIHSIIVTLLFVGHHENGAYLPALHAVHVPHAAVLLRHCRLELLRQLVPFVPLLPLDRDTPHEVFLLWSIPVWYE